MLSSICGQRRRSTLCEPSSVLVELGFFLIPFFIDYNLRLGDTNYVTDIERVGKWLLQEKN